MSELRWILLLVGVLFLIGLTAWESRRSRLAGAAARERVRALAQTIPFEQPEAAGSGASARESAAAPVPAWLARPATGAGPALGELPAATVSDFPLDAPEPEEQAIRAERRAAVPVEELPSVPLGARHGALQAAELGLQASASQAEAAMPTDAAAEPEAGEVPAAAELPPGAAPGVTVEWPPEEQRRIVSVRIVSPAEQRLSGRATRQALAACGFVHGRYRIFHQPDAQGHALVSCASLSKPGMFDPSSMDYQRYSGLSLFTVLPGPLSAPEAVDRLLLTALDLSARLDARLQDDAGQALDDARIAQLRTRYREFNAMAGPAA